MKYFLDFEFMEAGREKPLIPISLGIICENETGIYMENAEADLTQANAWVKENVIPHLQGGEFLLTYPQMREKILNFIPAKVGDDPAYLPPEFWGYFADYDWVLFCQLFGTMMDLPKGYPYFCMDLKQLAVHMGVPRKRFPEQETQVHHSMGDAWWNKKLYDYLMSHNRQRMGLKD